MRWSAVNPQLDFERHRHEREVVLAFETLREVAVAALLELETLQQPGEHQKQQIHRELFAGTRSRTCEQAPANNYGLWDITGVKSGMGE